MALFSSSRSATGFKRNLIQDEDRFQSFCNKIFAGWDFCITNENAAKLKRSSLLYEIKVGDVITKANGSYRGHNKKRASWSKSGFITYLRSKL